MKLVKGAWRLLVGLKDALVLLFMLLFFGGLYAALSSSPNPGGGKGGALLVALDGALVEQREAADPRAILTGAAQVIQQHRVRDVVHALRNAAKDDAIKTVVLDLDSFWGGGQVALEEVAEALDAVRAAKKPVLAFATGYSDDSYLLAAHASEIWLDPMGAAWFAGPGGKRPYFKGLADRFAVNVHVYRVGKYKSFVEPFTRDGQSPEARAASEALVGAIWANWQANIVKARPKSNVATYAANPIARIAEGGGNLAQTALKAGIVDKIGDRTAFAKRVAELSGSDDSNAAAAFRHSTLPVYLAANPIPKSGSAIGIIQVAGNIVDGEAPSGTAGGDTIAGLIQKAVKSGNFKALVVRVDSGGGSALASEKIRLALVDAKAQGLPVVASMASIAASGGYWVAMAGDKVFAEPSTITGSIGVFGVIPTFENTLARYGVTSDGVRTTPLSGQPDIIGGTTPETDAVLQGGVEDIYNRFLTLVSTQRKLPRERVAEIAQGRVWDGGTARQIGLFDEFGGLDDAVAEAARRAKLDPEDAYGVVIERQPGWLESLFEGFSTPTQALSGDLFAQLAQRNQARLFASLRDAEVMLGGTSIQARCLECPMHTPALPSDDRTLWTLILHKVMS